MERRNQVILSSDDEDDFKPDSKMLLDTKPPTMEKDKQGTVVRRAEMYQEYMKSIKIPSHHGSTLAFNTWNGLATSLKHVYGQPLHYLTNVLLKQWDQSRVGCEDEHLPLDTVIHPSKAEATIWLIEEVHRLTTSHHRLAKIWLLDPMHHANVDPTFPWL